MGKTVASAQQAAQNWQAGMTSPNTAAKYSQGIDRVSTSPMAAAAQQLNLYLARVTAAVQNGTMAAKLNGADFNQWKQTAKSVGAANLSKGVSKGMPKYAKKAQALQSIWQAASDAAHSLPKGGFAEAQARWAAATQVMMAAKGKV